MKRLLPFLLIITLFVPVHPLAAKPILTIDTGGHKALIRDVMFTKDGRYLVSASDDKTIRVWNTSTGEVVRVLRGQMESGAEGKIYAAALTQNDRLLAVGGGYGTWFWHRRWQGWRYSSYQLSNRRSYSASQRTQGCNQRACVLPGWKPVDFRKR